MSRERPLDPPHKGLRYQLGLLSTRTGATDFSRSDDVQALRDVAALTFGLLVEHASNEDDVLFAALESRSPGATMAAESDHPRLQQWASDLAARFAALDAPDDAGAGHELYLDLTCFQAEYLLHLAQEEREIEPALLQQFTDAELADLQVAISAGSDPGVLLDWFQVCVPARSDADNLAVLERMRVALPEPTFAAIRSRLEATLEPARFARLFGGRD